MSDKYAQPKQYNKLVRDKIPNYLKSKGIPYKSHIADDKEYLQKLIEKLKEEALELESEDFVEELADLLEVIYALADYAGISLNELEQAREDKLKQRGGFGHRIILEES